MTEEQPQPAVVELPYDALAGALRDFADELDPTDWHEDYRIMLERAAVVIESAAAVRAGAVAAERQRIAALIGALPNHADCAMNSQFRFGWNNARAAILEAVAAGSVPVATPEPCDHGQTEGHWATGTNEFGYGSTSVWCVGAVPVRLAQLLEALGEPYKSFSDDPREPLRVMTWERALSIVCGRTAVWRDLLRRAEEVDDAWLAAYRGGGVG